MKSSIALTAVFCVALSLLIPVSLEAQESDGRRNKNLPADSGFSDEFYFKFIHGEPTNLEAIERIRGIVTTLEKELEELEAKQNELQAQPQENAAALAALEKKIETTRAKHKYAARWIGRYSPPHPRGMNNPAQPVVTLPPPADAEERRARFAKRNSPAELKKLGEKLCRHLDLDSPGLGKVKELAAAEKYAEALEAFKIHFVDKLKNPKKYNISTKWFTDFFMIRPSKVSDQMLAEARKGIYPFPHRGKVYKFDVGQPGVIRWGHTDGSRTEPRSRENILQEFYRHFNRPTIYQMRGNAISSSIFFWNYLETQKESDLAEWCAFMDDWSMNLRAELENNPDNLRHYGGISPRDIAYLYGQLQYAAMTIPTFAEDLSAATLARVLMQYLEEYSAGYVRTARAAVFNWLTMGEYRLIRAGLNFQEFKAGQWILDEAKKQFERTCHFTLTPDGGAVEFSDEGHQGVWCQHLGFARKLLQDSGPDFFTSDWRTEFIDLYERNVLRGVRFLAPDGFRHNDHYTNRVSRFYPVGHSGFDHSCMVRLNPQIFENYPEAKRRIEWIYRNGEDRPEYLDDAFPYLGAYIQRQRWNYDAPFMYMRAMIPQNSNLDEDICAMNIWGNGKLLLHAKPIYVEGVTQDSHYGLTEHPGGKTSYLTYSKGQLSDGLWHSSKAFSLAEGFFRGVYNEDEDFRKWTPFTSDRRFDMPQLHRGEEPIKDVDEHLRSVYFLRELACWIVVDRISTDAEHNYEQRYHIYTPVKKTDWENRDTTPIEQPGRIDLNARQGTVRSLNPDWENVSIFNVASSSLSYSFLEGEDPEYKQFDPIRNNNLANKSDYEILCAEEIYKRGDRPGWTTLRSSWKGWLFFARRVKLALSGTGNQALVSLFQPRESQDENDIRMVRRISGDNGIVGFDAVTSKGKGISFRTAVEGVAKLTAESGEKAAAAEARALLLVDADGDSEAMRCLVIDGKSLALAGRHIKLKSPGAEYLLENGKVKEVKKAYRPIPRVTFTPDVNAFVDQVEVEMLCAEPGVEIRYTTDGSDPTVNSTLYEGPVRISETTMIKAVAMRPGLKEMPFSLDSTFASIPAFGVFEKQELNKATDIDGTELNEGLHYDYYTGSYFEIMPSATEQIAEKQGDGVKLFDVSMRDTENEFGVNYSGYIDVPEDGVYTFFAPEEFFYPRNDAGYELRVYVDGEFWSPAFRVHGEWGWSTALEKGLHPFKVVFVDFRREDGKIELWRGFPNPKVTWQGKTPELLFKGPGMKKAGEIPANWLFCD